MTKIADSYPAEISLLLVKWLDARKADRLFALEKFKSQEPIPIWTVGFGYEKEEAVVLAQDFLPLEEGDMPGDEAFRQIETIPRGCILEVIRLGKIKE